MHFLESVIILPVSKKNDLTPIGSNWLSDHKKHAMVVAFRGMTRIIMMKEKKKIYLQKLARCLVTVRGVCVSEREMT